MNILKEPQEIEATMPRSRKKESRLLILKQPTGDLAIRKDSTQTEKHGGIWHTKNDNLEFSEREFPGRVQEHLNHFTNMLTWVLADIKKEL